MRFPARTRLAAARGAAHLRRLFSGSSAGSAQRAGANSPCERPASRIEEPPWRKAARALVCAAPARPLAAPARESVLLTRLELWGTRFGWRAASSSARCVARACSSLSALAGGGGVLLSLLAACGAATFDGTVYRSGDVAFQVRRPQPGWERLEAQGSTLAFRDKDNAATIAVGGRCGADAEDVPLASLTQHLFLQFTDREILKQELVPFDGREAMHSVVLAKLDGVPKKFDVWVLKKDGCVYDLLFIAGPERFAAGLPAFERFVTGFSALPADDD